MGLRFFTSMFKRFPNPTGPSTQWSTCEFGSKTVRSWMALLSSIQSLNRKCVELYLHVAYMQKTTFKQDRLSRWLVLLTQYCAGDKIDKNEMGWACGAYGWGEGGVQGLGGETGGKETTGRPRRRWADNIRLDLQEGGCGYMDWIGLAQDRDRWRTLVSAVMNLRVPWNAGIFLTSCRTVSFSRRTLHHGVSK